MRKFLAPFLLFSLSAVVGCQSSRAELMSRQARLAGELKGITDSYLTTEVVKPNFGGKVFCAHKTLELVERADLIDEYVYALCQEYSARDGKLSEGTGAAIPVAVRFEKQDEAYRVASSRIPRDAGYANEVKRIFPVKTHDEIFYRRNDDLVA